MATATTANKQQQQIIEMLEQAYVMEIETVTNYLAHSVNLDGVRAEEIKGALAKDVMEELGHAQRLADRIKQVGGRVPGSLQLTFDQQSLQPAGDTTDVKSVIAGVLDAENAAIDHYRRIIRETDGDDFVTQDLMIQILGDEEKHRVQFEGYLAEYEKKS